MPTTVLCVDIQQMEGNPTTGTVTNHSHGRDAHAFEVWPVGVVSGLESNSRKATTKMSPQTKETFERAAYTAVGAPIAAVKALNARVGELRDAIRESRSELSDDLASEFENWVAEGERVVNEALERIRKSGTAEQARAASQKMRERVTKTVEEMSEEMSEALDVVEPEEDLDRIKGIGPGYRDRFTKAGIAGISSFLDQTATDEGVADLADRTGFTVSQIEEWRAQADLARISGIGASYMRLLHRVDIWTTSELAEADRSSLYEAITSVDTPGSPDQLPSNDAISKWIIEAKKLS